MKTSALSICCHKEPNIQGMWGLQLLKVRFHLTDWKKYQVLWGGWGCWDTEEDDLPTYCLQDSAQKDSSTHIFLRSEK